MQYVADPAKGRIRYTAREFASHWISTQSSGKEKGVAMFLEPTPKFYEQEDAVNKERRSFRFLFGYVRMYPKYFLQVIFGLLLGCLIQLILPFLTQSIVDVGIKNQNIGFIWLVLMGDLMQRMNDHGRVQDLLTSQTLNVMFSALSFVVFGIVLFFYYVTLPM